LKVERLRVRYYELLIINMLHKPFYDPTLSYEDNYEKGPFGQFGDGKVEMFEVKNRVTFLGQEVGSPFGIPAGPLLNAKFVRAALNKGFDIPVYKTVRSRVHPCHPAPNVLAVHIPGNLTIEHAVQNPLVADSNYTNPLGITNSFGVPSMSPDIWQKDLHNVVQTTYPGQLVVGSFQGTGGSGIDAYIADWVTTASLIKETGVKVVEANLSCPNEGTAHLLCLDIERSAAVLEAVKEELGNIPLIIKCAYMEQPYLEQFLQKVSPFIDAVAAINTIPATIIDKQGKQALPGEGRLKSGVCGAPIQWAGLDMVRRLNDLKKTKKYTYSIVGVGGVMTVADFKAYRNAGADVVMSATGAMWNPLLGIEIKNHFINKQ